MTSADTPRTDADEQLRAKIERIIGTAILKNDKNYTNGIMALIKADREQAVVEARIDELKHMKESADLYSDSSSHSLIIRVWLPERIKTLTAPSTAKGDKKE